MFVADLCKGSTADSDSVCLGSNPRSAAIKETSFVYHGKRRFFLHFGQKQGKIKQNRASKRSFGCFEARFFVFDVQKSPGCGESNTSRRKGMFIHRQIKSNAYAPIWKSASFARQISPAVFKAGSGSAFISASVWRCSRRSRNCRQYASSSHRNQAVRPARPSFS